MYLRLLENILRHQSLAFLIVEDYDFNAAAPEEIFLSLKVGVFADDDPGNFIK